MLQATAQLNCQAGASASLLMAKVTFRVLHTGQMLDSGSDLAV
ncbi:hypothetical protein X733_33430 [Mesorhizobium sp. L2C067A000]|nr:hypothetical protein X733_33430 [Mesorhizobium sp. L2C067A000]